MTGPLLDTMVLVGYLRGHPPAVEYLSGYDAHARPATHAVVVAELITGAGSRKDLLAVDRLVSGFEVVYPTPDDFKESLSLLRGRRLSMGTDFADSLIAATCVRLKMSLVTRNVRHFKGIRGLTVEAPY